MATTGIPHYDSIVGVHTVIAALATAGSLTGITGGTPLPASQVYQKWLPTDRDPQVSTAMVLPAVVVSGVPQPETNERSPNVYEDWGYPVGVTIIIPKNQSLTIDQDELGWRQVIRNAFHNKQPAAVVTELGTTPLKICRVEPGSPIDVGIFRDENLLVSFFVVRVVTRETR